MFWKKGSLIQNDILWHHVMTCFWPSLTWLWQRQTLVYLSSYTAEGWLLAVPFMHLEGQQRVRMHYRTYLFCYQMPIWNLKTFLLNSDFALKFKVSEILFCMLPSCALKSYVWPVILVPLEPPLFDLAEVKPLKLQKNYFIPKCTERWAN